MATLNTRKAWRFAPHDLAATQNLARSLQCSPLLAQVLVARGLANPNDAGLHLNNTLQDLCDPDLLPGCAEAADRVLAAIRAGRRVTIYGDYDVDGVTATSLLWHCLKLVGEEHAQQADGFLRGPVEYYIPSRLEEGYGLNADALRKLHEDDPEQLVISVDCGVSAIEEVALAKQLGLELIVTDHHKFSDTLPDCLVVHPRRGELDGSPAYPGGDLCGAGVAFKLAWAICKRSGDGERATPAMRDYLIAAVGLAAMGTIADCVPLVSENRVIATHGLKALKGHLSEGLKALKIVASITPEAILASEDIGFGLAPRINAAGRLGQARLAVELLTTEDAARAAQLAAYVDQLNKQRQSVERKILKQAKELVEENADWLDAPALVLASDEWHPGVIGIVASRVAEQYGKPAFLIALNNAEGVGQGSGRSLGLIDLHAALTRCGSHLLGYGGHAAAAGLQISADKIDDFREALCMEARSQFDGPDEELPVVELNVDAEVDFETLTHGGVREIDRMGPFGQMNERPVFVASGVTLAGQPKKMGGGDRHLSVRFQQGAKSFRAISFGRGEWADELSAAGGPFTIAFSAAINAFRGHESVELKLIDWAAE